MKEIKKEVKGKEFISTPLLCLMDGAPFIWKVFKEVFKDILNKALILDSIHVLEYIWLIAHCNYKEKSAEGKKYVYEKLLLILKGGVAEYIEELQKEYSDKGENAQNKTFLKVITYLKNHTEYMQYDLYLARGYPIGTGVVESACSHLVKNRMELAGARWGISGAESILKLRSIAKSKDWDAYWKFYIQQMKQCDFIDDKGLKMAA